jgi:DsbC/DsbD-like thiol-disulfide interchange protein
MKKTFTIFLCASFLSLPVLAQEAAKTEYASAHFVMGDKKNEAGLDITLADGWYTYWRMPGDNGLAPKFDWTGSANVRGVEISWPAPSRFTVMDMHSFGYRNHVLLPLQITPENPDAPVTLDLKLDLVVCHEICVPQSLHVTGDSAVQEKRLLDDAKESLPQLENSEDLGMTAAVLGKESLVITAYAKGGFQKDADIVIETPGPLLTAPPQILIDEKDQTRAVLKVIAPVGMDLTKELFGKEATIVLIHGGKSLERNFSF